MYRPYISIGMIWLLGICMFSCTPKVEPIQFGKEACTHCKMIISDPRFGGELVSEKGKVYKFDAVECMLDYLNSSDQQSSTHAFIQAIGYDTPGKLHTVEHLNFFISPDLPSPMGANISSFIDRNFTHTLQKEGVFYNWEELRNKQQTESTISY